MKPDSPSSSRERVIGLSLAVIGISINQLLVPAFAAAHPWLAMLGKLTALAGLGTVLLGIRRRIARDEIAATRDRSTLLPSP